VGRSGVCTIDAVIYRNFKSLFLDNLLCTQRRLLKSSLNMIWSVEPIINTAISSNISMPRPRTTRRGKFWFLISDIWYDMVLSYLFWWRRSLVAVWQMTFSWSKTVQKTRDRHEEKPHSKVKLPLRIAVVVLLARFTDKHLFSHKPMLSAKLFFHQTTITLRGVSHHFSLSHLLVRQYPTLSTAASVKFSHPYLYLKNNTYLWYHTTTGQQEAFW